MSEALPKGRSVVGEHDADRQHQGQSRARGAEKLKRLPQEPQAGCAGDVVVQAACGRQGGVYGGVGQERQRPGDEHGEEDRQSKSLGEGQEGAVGQPAEAKQAKKERHAQRANAQALSREEVSDVGAKASQNVVAGLEFVCKSRVLDDADVHGPREEGGDHREGEDQRQAEGEQAGHRARPLV